MSSVGAVMPRCKYDPDPRGCVERHGLTPGDFPRRIVVRTEDVEAAARNRQGEEARKSLRVFRGEPLDPDADRDGALGPPLLRDIRGHLTGLRRRQRAKFNRHVPTGTLLRDRWELASELGFGEGSSVYDECLVLGDVEVGRHCWVGPYAVLDGLHAPLKIGDHVDIGTSAQIHKHDTIERSLTGHRAPVFAKETTIGHCCFIAPQATIAPGTVIGDHSFVAAGSYVEGAFPPYSYIAGNPAKVVGSVEIRGGQGPDPPSTRRILRGPDDLERIQRPTPGHGGRPVDAEPRVAPRPGRAGGPPPRGGAQMSSVSVVIPCYNYARYLEGCVESVLGQSGVDLRLLIVDDASLDDSDEVAAGLAARDGRVRCLRHEVNRGHIATYNEGLEWATGDYTLLLSADDLLTPGALARAAGLMDDHPEVAMVHGRQVVFHPGEPLPAPREVGPDRGMRVDPGLELIGSMCASGSNPVATPTVLVRTPVQKELGGYRADLPHTADMELWLRFASRGPVGFVDADQALKRMHPNNMQLQYLGPSLGDIRQRLAAFEAFFGARGGPVEGGVALRRRARESLALEAFWAASAAFEEGDSPRSGELIAFAMEADPDFRSRPEWARFRWKRLMGPRAWMALGPLLGRVRRSTARGRPGPSTAARHAPEPEGTRP